MENSRSRFGRFVINVERYQEILHVIDQDKRLTGRNVLRKIKQLEESKFLHIVEWETKDFTLIGRCKSIFRGTLLHVAAALGYKRVVKALLEGGAGVNAKCFRGFTPLYFAIKHAHTEVLQILLAAGADLHAVDRKGTTPLHLAAACGSPEETKALLLAGADVNAKDNYLNTPLHFAVNARDKTNMPETVRILVQFGADVNAKDQLWNTVLHRNIVKKDNLMVIEGLLTDYESNARELGRRIFSLNQEPANEKVVKLLLERGAVTEERNLSGDTVLHCALEYGSVGVIRLLIQHGADVNARNFLSRAPLYCLLSRHSDAPTDLSVVVKLLIGNGSDIYLTNNRGVSTLEEILTSTTSRGLHLVRKIIRCALVEDPERNKPYYLQRYDHYSRYWDRTSSKVKREIKRMSVDNTHQIYFSLIRSENLNKLASYVQNENSRAIMNSGCYKRRYPCHKYQIAHQYDKGLERFTMLNRGEKSIEELYRVGTNSSKIFPQHIAREIVSHLTNSEIECLNDAVYWIATEKSG